MRAVTGSRFSLQLASVKLQDCSMPCEADNQVYKCQTVVSNLLNFRRRYSSIHGCVDIFGFGRVRGRWAAVFAPCLLWSHSWSIWIDSPIPWGRSSIWHFAISLFPSFTWSVVSFVLFSLYEFKFPGVVGEDRFACGNYGSTPTQLVTQEGENVWCSALAVAHYYFLMASSAW